MATLLDVEAEVPPTAPPEPKSKKAPTAAFKVIPETRPLRDRSGRPPAAYVRPLDKAKPLTRDDFRAHSEALLKQLGLGEQYLGFTLVCIANEFWREQVAAVPFNRRLMLAAALPEERRGLPGRLRRVRPRLPQVRGLLGRRLQGQGRGPRLQGARLRRDADRPEDHRLRPRRRIVGVACLNVLEKAIDKILLAGIPCVAAPLLSSNCKSTSVDDDWVFEMIDLQTDPAAAADQELRPPDAGRQRHVRGAGAGRASPRGRRTPGQRPTDPLAAAREHRLRLAGPGRQAVPAAHHPGRLRRPDGRQGHAVGRRAATCPIAVKRTALAIEAFHKASLVHDDIEDDDTFRYGPRDAAPAVRHRHRHQRRRLPDRPGLPTGQPRAQGARRRGAPPTSSTSWPTPT